MPDVNEVAAIQGREKQERIKKLRAGIRNARKHAERAINSDHPHSADHWNAQAAKLDLELKAEEAN